MTGKKIERLPDGSIAEGIDLTPFLVVGEGVTRVTLYPAPIPDPELEEKP